MIGNSIAANLLLALFPVCLAKEVDPSVAGYSAHCGVVGFWAACASSATVTNPPIPRFRKQRKTWR